MNNSGGTLTSGANYGNSKLYSFTITRGGEVIHDLVPAVRTSDSQPGLYYSGFTSVLVADPQFRSRARGDLHIRASSPCRDTGRGASIAAGTVDLDGLPRIFGKAVDMGCYENQSLAGTFLFVK